MINPNKEYKASQTGVIISIEAETGYLPEFVVSYRNNLYKGFIKDIPNFKRFKVGDRVKCGMSFYITSDRFRVTRMRLVKI